MNPARKRKALHDGVFDNAERQKMEDVLQSQNRQLRASELRFRTLFESASDGLLLADIQTGKLVLGNSMMGRMLGYTTEEVKSLCIKDIHPEKDLPHVMEQLRKLSRKDIAIAEDIPVKRQDGSLWHADISGGPIAWPGKIYLLAIFRDISERKREQAVLEEKAEKYGALVETTTTGYVIIDDEGKVLDANPEYVRLTGRRELKEIAGKSVTEWTADYEKDKNATAIKMCLKEGCIRNLEVDYVGENGCIVPVEINATVVMIGGRQRILTLCRDITERKQQAGELAKYRAHLEALVQERTERIRVSEVSYRRLFETTQDGILLLDAETGRILDANPFLLDLLRYSKAELLGQQLWKIEAFKNIKTPKKSLLELQEKECIRYENLQLRSKDGRLVEVEFVSNAYQVDHRKVIQCNVRDITQRRRAEDEARASASRFESIFNESMEGMLLADPQNKRFVMCNPAICRMLGYTEEELMRLCVNDIHPVKELPHVTAVFEAQARGDLKLAPSLAMKRKDGSVFYADVNTSQLILKEKKYLMGSFRDVTSRIKADEIKSNFMNMVSHELKTPMTIIQANVSLVAQGKVGAVNEKQKELLLLATRCIKRLMELINQMLDFQKMDAGMMKFRFADNDINEAVEEIQVEMAPLARKRGLKCLLKLDAALPRTRFDKDKIIGVLTNLVGNAIKFTEKGHVTITTSRKNDCIQVSVQDTGEGVREEDMPKLFERFTQLETKVGGTGLGLAISKEIVEAHKGRIWAESEFGKGMTVHFVLPITAVSA